METGREPGRRWRVSGSSQSPRQDRPSKGAEDPRAKPVPQAHLDLLEAALQQIAEGVVIADLEGHFLFVNAAARKIGGMDPVDSTPADWPSLYGCFLSDKKTPYPPQRLPLARAMRGEPVPEEEIFIRNPCTPEGAWISVSASPLRNGTGALAGGVVVFRDVTAHHRSREVVQQFSQAVEKTTDAVFITDVEAAIEYVNPAFEETTGYSREEAIGRNPSILRSGLQEAGLYERLWNTVLAGEVHSGSLVNRRKDGRLFHAEQTITPIRDSSGQIAKFVSVMRDVSELKKGQEREVEIRLARTVQEKMYPARPPRLAGFDLAGAAVPADHTGGDYFDFIPLDDGRVVIAVGDVSGHGFSAALLMAETRAYLRSLLRSSTDLVGILRQLNVLLCEDTEDERFVTLLLTILDPARRSLVSANAGHIPGYLLGQETPGHILDATGMPLGLFDDAEFLQGPEIPLAEGDLLLLLTDGATEAQNADGDFFEAEGVLRVVSELRHRSAAGVVRGIHSAVEAFIPRGVRRDDVTAVVGKVGPSP